MLPTLLPCWLFTVDPVNTTTLNEKALLFTYYFAARKDLQSRLPKGPAYYLERFYYDTANAMTIHPLASLTKLVNPRKSFLEPIFPS